LHRADISEAENAPSRRAHLRRELPPGHHGLGRLGAPKLDLDRVVPPQELGGGALANEPASLQDTDGAGTLSRGGQTAGRPWGTVSFVSIESCNRTSERGLSHDPHQKR
jgi:hypothetical protein